MTITNLFPALQAIYRDLQQPNSAVELRYSATTVTLHSPADRLLSKQVQEVILIVVLVVMAGVSFYSGSYFVLLWAVALGAWHWYKGHKDQHDFNVLRFQNTLILDVTERQVRIEYHNPHYQEHVQAQETLKFEDILQVGVRIRKRRIGSEMPDFGQLFFTLADDTLLYVAELPDERIAHNLAHVFQQSIGLPTQPWREKPWFRP
ncbi:hypothetical protein [Hymenobacter yonginensis]|uniref:YcxB-like protein domain-containing protein n=1 Tax=Hymenobacter yonginensis TaxID=748197 RepID=A0ABY7PU39_9BACT|nr:hypothetical protein [Hymenobacter yonginensis]WBO86369.1 hypothetical protein O9Z63_08920 [Hymenobacter yonginensis]